MIRIFGSSNHEDPYDHVCLFSLRQCARLTQTAKPRLPPIWPPTPAPIASACCSTAPSEKANSSGTQLWPPIKTSNSPAPSKPSIPALKSMFFEPDRQRWRKDCSLRRKQATPRRRHRNHASRSDDFPRESVLLPYTSPHLAAFPEDAEEKAPKNLVYWTNTRESFIGFAYNKNFLNAADVPKNFDGLLKPTLRDNMGYIGRRYRRSHHRRHGQGQRRWICQKAERAEYSGAHDGGQRA